LRHPILYCAVVGLLAFSSAANATTFRFDTDPFAGTTVLNTPGRQIVGGEDFINFSTGSDVFSLESTVFGVENTVNFVNAPAANLPTGGVNVVVLESFDDDNNPLTPFGAGNAATLIANEITTSGAGFFVYFNQGLDLPRLVFSSDLSSSTADLKILARMLNLTGQTGRDTLPSFTAGNFEITTADSTTVPEPSNGFIILSGLGACWYFQKRKRLQVL